MGNSINNAPSHVNPLLNPSRLEATLIEAFGHAMPTCAHIEYRLVGTGAALLHGVPLPAGDIDLLVKERQSVDAFSSALSFFKCLTPPAYLADARQYFAEYEINNIAIGISTVEWQTESDGIECFGRGPWAHFILPPAEPIPSQPSHLNCDWFPNYIVSVLKDTCHLSNSCMHMGAIPNSFIAG